VVGARVGVPVALAGDVGQELQVTGQSAAIWGPYVASAQYAARSVHVAGAPLMVKPVSVVSTHAPAGATGAGVAGATGAAVGDRVAGLGTGALVGEATTGAGVAHDALAQMPVKRVIGAWPPERHFAELS